MFAFNESARIWDEDRRDVALSKDDDEDVADLAVAVLPKYCLDLTPPAPASADASPVLFLAPLAFVLVL